MNALCKAQPPPLATNMIKLVFTRRGFGSGKHELIEILTMLEAVASSATIVSRNKQGDELLVEVTGTNNVRLDVVSLIEIARFYSHGMWSVKEEKKRGRRAHVRQNPDRNTKAGA